MEYVAERTSTAWIRDIHDPEFETYVMEIDKARAMQLDALEETPPPTPPPLPPNPPAPPTQAPHSHPLDAG